MAIAQLTVDITAKMASFENEIKKASNTAKAQADSISNSFSKIGDSLKGAVTAYAGLEGIKFIADLVTSTADYAKEVQNLSNLTGLTTDNFQRLAYGAKSVGIDQEKLAAVIEDTNEKFGEYLSTGAGPLKDFFDVIAPKVGVTADNFRRLSGPEALQLYVSSLEKAGVNQQQMTFYMKALAGDATALIPLLQDNGKAMQEMGDKAEAAGAIMGQKALQDAKKYNEQLKELSDQATVTGRSIATDLFPALTNVLKITNDSLPTLKTYFGELAKFGGINPLSMLAGNFATIKSLMSETKAPAIKFDASTGGGRGFVNPSQNSIGVIETAADIAKAQKEEEARLKKLASEKSKYASKAQSDAEKAKRDSEQQKKSVDDYIKSLSEQTSAFKEQSTEQKALSEIESGRFGKVLPAQKERILNAAQIVDADKKEIEFQKVLTDSEEKRKKLQEDMIEQGKSIYEQMRTPAEIYANQVMKINELYQAKAVSLETLERATQKYFDAYKAGADDQGEKIKTNTDLSRGFESAISNTFMTAIRDGRNFGDLLVKLGEDIAYMILQQQIIAPVAKQIVAPIAKAGGNWLAGLLKFDGGGYTGTGTRSGGVDGKGGFYAVLHPDETVVDHTKGQRIVSAGGQNVVVNQTYNFAGGADRMQVLGAAQLGAAMAKQQIIDDRKRGRM